TFERISLLLRTNSAAIAAWLAWFKESRADLGPSAAQAAALSAPPSPSMPESPSAPPSPIAQLAAPSAELSAEPAVAARQESQLLEACAEVPEVATSPADSSEQESVPLAASPVFIVPAIPSPSPASELAPVLQAFEHNAPASAQEAQPQPIAASNSELEFNMAMDEEEMFSLFDD
ncbi:MAG: hypothetical protein ACRC9T_09415, partial [Vibrionaceae bacterium]